MKQTSAVIYRSENGRTNWQPIPAAEVPAFVKDPVTMGRLLAGEECMDVGEGDRGSAWYRAIRVVTQGERATVEAALRSLH